jgi:hypothetical protein
MDAPDALRIQVQELITRGALPKEKCAAIWYGYGQGQRCRACRKRILGTQPSVECDTLSGGTVPLHAECYSVWHAVITGS